MEVNTRNILKAHLHVYLAERKKQSKNIIERRLEEAQPPHKNLMSDIFSPTCDNDLLWMFTHIHERKSGGKHSQMSIKVLKVLCGFFG